MSDSWRPHGLQPTRLLHPWDFPGNSTGVGSELEVKAAVDPERPFSKLKKVLPLGQLLLGLLITPLFEF